VDDGGRVAMQVHQPTQNLPGPAFHDLRIHKPVALAIPDDNTRYPSESDHDVHMCPSTPQPRLAITACSPQEGVLNGRASSGCEMQHPGDSPPLIIPSNPSCSPSRQNVNEEAPETRSENSEGRGVLTQCARCEQLCDKIDGVALLFEPRVVEGHDVFVFELLQHPNLCEEAVPVLLGGHKLIHADLVPRHL
jgi:hypothetical protein